MANTLPQDFVETRRTSGSKKELGKFPNGSCTMCQVQLQDWEIPDCWLGKAPSPRGQGRATLYPASFFLPSPVRHPLQPHQTGSGWKALAEPGPPAPLPLAPLTWGSVMVR